MQHPDIAAALEIDISTTEAAKLTDSTLRLVSMTIFEPNKAPRSVQMETKVLDRLFGDVDFDRVLEGARRADLKNVPPSQRPGRTGAAPSRGDKIDYTAADRFGQLHRGRITAEEARLVREQQSQASANRAGAGPSPDRLRRSGRAQALRLLSRVDQPARWRRQRASMPGSS